MIGPAMSRLTEFLLARIAEDKAAARAASPGPWHLNAEHDEVLAVDDLTVCDGFALSGPQTRATTAHIARHDPERVLRECEAKRRIVTRHGDCGEGYGYCDDGGKGVWRPEDGGPACADLFDLASVYAEHPDYREEWKP